MINATFERTWIAKAFRNVTRVNPKKTYFEQCDEIYYLISLRDAENVHNEYSTVDLTKSEE